ncbi:ATP-binding protein [Alcaligenaceae bacterium A4P071]|nr:ATP-binding protein [Alcaligenaceae bacterium A4P071]
MFGKAFARRPQGLDINVKRSTQPFDWTRLFSRDVLENFPAAVYVCDAQGVVVAFNSKATQLWGREPIAGDPKERFCGAHRMYSMQGEHLHASNTPLAAVLETGKPLRDLEAIIEQPDGTRYNVLANVTPLFDDEGAMQGYVNCVLDVTRYHQMKSEHAELQHALNQSQKIDSIGQLTGGIAHDFNNMLQGITGALSLLRRSIATGRPDSSYRYIDIAEESATRAAALTHRLLSFARRQTLDAKPLDVNALLLAMRDLFARSLNDSISLQFELSEDAWTVKADANQLENAILNLVINARDAMPEGGVITIKTINTTLDGAYARRYPDVRAGDYCSISVLDTGAGMTPDVISHIFEPFFTTKLIGEGTGLGLSMAHGFVKQSGGHISVSSREREGTTMNLLLPRYMGDRNVSASVKAVPAPPANRASRILLVEDDDVARALLKEALIDLGYVVFDAAQASGALALSENLGNFELLITDVGLPDGLNGRQLAQAIRTTKPFTKVLFITGYASSIMESREQTEDMQVLAKPFSLDSLAKRVHGLLGGLPPAA